MEFCSSHPLYKEIENMNEQTITITREQLRSAMSAVYNQKGGPRITLEDVLFGPEEESIVIEAEVVPWQPTSLK